MNKNPLVNNQTNDLGNYSKLELVSESEHDLDSNDERKMLNIINSSICYFTRDLRPTNLSLVCYYCDKKCYPIDIQSFTNRYIKGVSVFDVPICPYCHIDAIVDIKKLRQNKMEESELLYQMKKLMFE